MKKLYSLITTGAIIASGLTALPTNATNSERNNILSVTSESVMDNITLYNDMRIPAGSVALTISIRNNDGFNSSSTKLDIDGADILVDEKGKPIVVKGEILDNSIIAAAEKDNILVVSSAATNETTNDGNLFTVFVSNTPSDITVTDVSNESVSIGEFNLRDTEYIYYIGDVDHNTYVNAVDATWVLQALDTYANGNPTQLTYIPVSVAQANINTYFPYVHYADAADTNDNSIINIKDADNILEFYSFVQTGYTPAEAYDLLHWDYNFCGREESVMEP